MELHFFLFSQDWFPTMFKIIYFISTPIKSIISIKYFLLYKTNSNLLPFILGCFLPGWCNFVVVGLELDNLFGKANIAKEANINNPAIKTRPNNYTNYTGDWIILYFLYTQPPSSNPSRICRVDLWINSQVSVNTCT